MPGSSELSAKSLFPFSETNLPGPKGSGLSITQLADAHRRPSGRFKVINTQKALSPSGIGFTATVGVRENTIAEEEVRLLGRAATQYKKTNAQAAIDCLLRAQAISRAIESPHTVDWWLRLPKYLHKAGRTLEALAACDQLHQETPARLLWGAPANQDRGAFVALEQGQILKLRSQIESAMKYHP